MKGNERGDGLTTPLLMETLEDRNAATSLSSLHLPVHLPVLQAHTHHHSTPAHSHGWAFAWGHGGHGHSGHGHSGHGHCGGHQSPPPASPPPASPPPASPPAAGGTLSGVVFEDNNGNHTRDEGEAAAPAGRQVFVDTDGDGVFDRSTTTGANGTYTLTGLPTGVQLTIQSVNDNGDPSPTVTVTIGSTGSATQDVGLFLAPS